MSLVALHQHKGLRLDGRVYVDGFPSIEIVEGGEIIVGNHVWLNSRRRNYHASMFGPVRLVVSRPDGRIEIGEDTRVHGSCLHARKLISVGKRCLIAANCQILDSHGHESDIVDVVKRISTVDEPRGIHIENDVWIGLNCIVLRGVTIGAGSIVAAGSVVTKSLPPMSVCAGAPAVVVRKIDPPER